MLGPVWNIFQKRQAVIKEFLKKITLVLGVGVTRENHAVSFRHADCLLHRQNQSLMNQSVWTSLRLSRSCRHACNGYLIRDIAAVKTSPCDLKKNSSPSPVMAKIFSIIFCRSFQTLFAEFCFPVEVIIQRQPPTSQLNCLLRGTTVCFCLFSVCWFQDMYLVVYARQELRRRLNKFKRVGT